MAETAVPRDGAAPRRALLRLSAGLARLAGWRRFTVAALLGGLGTLALPPAHVVPVLLVSFPGLLWLLSGTRSARGAFALGWWFGFGHFLLGLYWVSFALLTDIERYWWMLPVAATGLPALLALFTGLATLASHWVARRWALDAVTGAIAFAMIWTGVEWLRGHVLTGFPWNLIGYAWVEVPAVLQVAALTGIYGLGLLTVLAAALPAALGAAEVPARRTAGACLAALLVLAAGAGWGAWRLATATDDTVPGVRLRLVQPNILQSLKWAPEEREANFRRHLALARAPGFEDVTHIVWPETAVPFFLGEDRARRLAVAAATPPGGLTLTGAPRVERSPGRPPRYWNSLEVIDDRGERVAVYDKFHLVPFGEYMPLRRWLPVAAIAAGSTDFSAGPGPRTLEVPGLPPVSPLICYEIIFPGAVKDANHRPAWLLNITNDAWYGHTAGPHQHFAIARVRAVEEGLPLVRVANTGISGVVDAYGRVRARLALGTQGVLDSPLPVPLANTPPYGLTGDWILVLMLMSLVGISTLARHRAGRSS